MKNSADSDKCRGTKSRENYLEKCADILCEAAYRMCRDNFGRGKSKEKCDPKILKDTCSAVKEAAAVASGLDKKEVSSGEEIRIVFEGPEEYAE